MINTSFFRIFSSLFCILAMAACYSPRYVYSPSAQNVPLLLKRGDSKLAAAYATNLSRKNIVNGVEQKNQGRGFDLQGAYALTRNFAVQLNYYHRTERNSGDYNTNNPDSSLIRYRRNLTEIGFGYYRSLARNRLAFFQVFAGIGFGKSGFTDRSKDLNNIFRDHFHEAGITKLYVQPAFTVKNKKNFSATLSSRFSVIYFHDIKTDYSAIDLDNYKLDSLHTKPRLFWEPAVINTFGFKKLPGLQIELQAGFSLLESKLFVDYRSFNFSAGVLFDVPKLLGKKK